MMSFTPFVRRTTRCNWKEMLREKYLLCPPLAESPESGVCLGWLFQPDTEVVFIYRPGQAAERRQGYQQTISGEVILPGFTFDLQWLR